MKMVGLELFKLRRKHIYIMILLFLLVEIVWVFASTGMAMTRFPGRVGWKDVIMTVASMNSLFLPIIIAVVVSRICDMEHKGNTWKLIMAAAVERRHIYAAKYACACILMLFSSILQLLAITVFGIANSFVQPVPVSLLLLFFAGTMLTNMVVTALQQWISLAVKNQSFALCLGMLGGFIGMTADLFPAAVRRVFVWSYYTGLCPVTYNYVNETMEFVTRNVGAYLPVAVLLVGAAIYIAGCFFVSRQEV